MVAQFAVILAAAGSSSRFKDRHYKKPFAPLADRAVWLHSADKFLNRDDVVQVMIVVAPDDEDDFRETFGANIAILGLDVVAGGATRTDSVRNALSHVKPEAEFVAVHDAARPCLASEWIDNIFAAAVKNGAAILATPVVSTLKRVARDGLIQETISRTDLWEAQTPQVFRRDWLIEAYARAGSAPATDDAELVQRIGKPVVVVAGSPVNLKITTRDDLRFAEHALKALPKPKLSGPAHPFQDDHLWR